MGTPGLVCLLQSRFEIFYSGEVKNNNNNNKGLEALTLPSRAPCFLPRLMAPHRGTLLWTALSSHLAPAPRRRVLQQWGPRHPCLAVWSVFFWISYLSVLSKTQGREQQWQAAFGERCVDPSPFPLPATWW